MSLHTLSQILGGIGLFLLGMVLLTDGLKAVAGDSLRVVLSRFTGGPVRAFATGMGLTCLVQSSSATVLTTIGFVSAGLLTFPQAVGVVMGAAVGTTSTGWIVSLLGLKFSVSVVALPLVGLGALARLLSGGRLASAGIAFAGFGLIFIGIDVLREGMGGLGTVLDPTRFPGDALGGRVLLILIGAAMTVVMQSSSAAVVMTLAGFDAQTITLDQAAALIVGQSMGTAVTAAIATIGASVPAKRTAMAHIVFNISAGVMAFLLLPVFLSVAEAVWPSATGAEGGAGAARSGDARAHVPPVALAGFHTAFTLLSAALVLPGAKAYAGLITRLVRDRGPVLTQRLDPTVRSVPAVAVEAARLTLVDIAKVAVEAVRGRLAGESDGVRAARLGAAEAALAEIRVFLTGVGASAESESVHRVLVSTLHALDHTSRLVDVIGRRLPMPDSPGILRAKSLLAGLTTIVEQWLEGDHKGLPQQIESIARELADMRRRQRIVVLERTAAGEAGAGEALVALDAMRLLDRMAYHMWRIAHHLQTPPPPAEGAELEGLDPL